MALSLEQLFKELENNPLTCVKAKETTDGFQMCELKNCVYAQFTHKHEKFYLWNICNIADYRKMVADVLEKFKER